MNLLHSTVLTLMLLMAGNACAELALVVNESSQVSSLSRSEVVNIFMGRYRRMPSGGVALPAEPAPVKERFYRALVNKDLAEINSYWARLIFSGQATPPVQFEDEQALIEFVRNNPGALGVMDLSAVPPDLKVVMTLPSRQGL